jgi:hypothetical protein
MEISDHVKKLAREAVNQNASTAQIRRFPDSGKPISLATPFTYTDPEASYVHPIPEQVKLKAMDVLNDPVVRAQIRLVKETGHTSPPMMLPYARGPHAEKIARLHELGLGTDSIQWEITQDSFGR